MTQYMLDRGWADQVRGSVFAGHFRTGRYYGSDRDNSIPESVVFPPETDPHEPDDRTGFVFRSFERWDEKLTKLLGYRPIMQSTETGIEPHECRKDLALHADLNMRMAQMQWTPSLDCCYWWIMIPGGMGGASAWLDNSLYGKRLPVVASFMQMPRPVRNGLPPEPPVIQPPDGIGVHPGYALYDYAQVQGYGKPVTDEWDNGPIREQCFERGRVWCVPPDWAHVWGIKT